jgi:ABC-type branched-subunit amino acid transport system ATPase component/ABC-type branched-subunit amino acid transport system permease subunit
VVDAGIYLLLTMPLIGAYAMMAIGIVVIFRASRVLNLAHGAMAMAPAYLVYTLSRRHVPMGLALLVGIAFGALLGAATERLFVRPLRRQGPTAQTVGTVAVFGVVVSVIAKVYGTTPLTGPRLFPAGGIRLRGSTLLWGNVGLLLTAAVVAVAFILLFRFTNLGLMLRGAADNRVAAGLVGVNPDRAALVAWLIGGGLAALAGILLGGVTSLSPYSLALQMLPAFVAALLGGLGSIGGAIAGAVLVGALTGLVPAFGLIPWTRTYASQLGMPQLVLTILALVVMYTRGGRYSATDIRESAAGANDSGLGRRRYEPDPADAARALRRRVRNYAVLVALLAWPFLGAPFSLLGDAVQAALFVVAASSIVLLTGWVGQISLAQAAFVGIGAFGSALVIRATGLPFPANLVVAALIAGAGAAGLGIVALRVRGLYLAVATLIFAYMADSYLFVAPWFAGQGGVTSVDVKPIGTPGTAPYFDLSERRTFYFVALAVAAGVLFGLANLRDSKTGRAFFAIRGSETAAASLGIDVRRYKLLAFALAGAIAGLAGNLLLVSQGSAVSAQFGISVSLLYLAIAVVGGLQSLEGLVVSAVIFAALNELFYRVTELAGYLEVVSAGLLAVVLLLYPGGLAQLPGAVRRLLRREPDAPEETAAVREAVDVARLDVVTRAARAAVPEGVPVLEARDVRVEFDGLVAVDRASLRLDEGQIVGLIGPNGAGKTTLFNAISGLVRPTSGTVHLFGDDVTSLEVHERARLGLGRTFQAIQLFPQLSVYENLLVATHGGNASGLFAHVALTRRGLRQEAAAEDAVRRVVAAMGLEPVADRAVGGLPFGVLRQVEIARTVVTGAPVVMLDEPASGLDNAETDRLSALLYGLRDRLGLTLLLIEHDVRMVTEVSDHMYVLVYGKIVASGTPDEIRRDPVVTAAYLGEPTGAETPADAVLTGAAS